MPSIRSLTVAVTSGALGLALMGGSVPASAMTAHMVDSEAVMVGSSHVTPGYSYAFGAVMNGKPVRWNPCQSIHWRSNTSRGPKGGLGVLKSAVATIASATRTHWVYDGPTSRVPRVSVLNARSSAAQPVVLGWTDRYSSDLLSGRSASTAGMTRTLWFSSTSSHGTVSATRAAVVALNRASRLPLHGAVSWQTVATHELGHVMGLAHSRTSAEVMAPVLSTRISSLQAGDRAGLQRVGRDAGCIAFPS